MTPVDGENMSHPEKRLRGASVARGAGIALAAGLVFAVPGSALALSGKSKVATFAGTGVAGVAKDNTLRTAAALSGPSALARDAAGNIFVADACNHAISRIDAATGKISRVAGGAVATKSKEATKEATKTATKARITAERKAAAVTLESLACAAENGFAGDGAAATAAALNAPRGVAVDKAGNLYIADTNNHRIRKVDAKTGVISTIAGLEAAGLSGDGELAVRAALRAPTAIKIAPDGNLVFADTGNQRVRKIDLATGKISTLAGAAVGVEKAAPAGGFEGDGAAATKALLNTPTGIAFSKSGELLIADAGNRRLRAVNAAGAIRTVAGGAEGAAVRLAGAKASKAVLALPTRIAVDKAGRVLVTDTAGGMVQRINLDKDTIDTVAGDGTVEKGTGDGAAAEAARFAAPFAIGFDAKGNLLVGDPKDNKVRQVLEAAPVAKMADLGALKKSAAIAFDARASYDPDGEIVSHVWDFGDGTKAEGANPSKTFTKAGTYNVKLTVTDDAGVSTSLLTKVVVAANGTAAIRSFAWDDADGDGIRDRGEKFIKGLTVKLYRDGKVIASTKTNARGQYAFEGLEASDSYKLRFLRKKGQVFANWNKRASKKSVSVALRTGKTLTFSLADGEVLKNAKVALVRPVALKVRQKALRKVAAGKMLRRTLVLKNATSRSAKRVILQEKLSKGFSIAAVRKRVVATRKVNGKTVKRVMWKKVAYSIKNGVITVPVGQIKAKTTQQIRMDVRPSQTAVGASQLTTKVSTGNGSARSMKLKVNVARSLRSGTLPAVTG